MPRHLSPLAIAALLLTGAAASSTAVQEGLNLNSFTKDGPVAAHLLLRAGDHPRLLVAFPAGNSGVGLWFKPTLAPVTWQLVADPTPVTQVDAQGRPLHGIRFSATAHASALDVERAVLSSIRVLRDYQALGSAPAAVAVAPQVADIRITWSRNRLDGAPGYRLQLTVTHGRLAGEHLLAGSDGTIGITVEALTGEPPLTPFAPGTLLNAHAAANPAARRALDFLAFREKFLAGSWRFDTYFGRDTLMSLALLAPALQPAAMEAGLAAVLTRLSPEGNVAHEEDIGEFAVLDHRRTDGTTSAAPVYDYRMVDSAFLLAPVAGAWLLDDPRGRAGAAAFLARPIGEQTAGAALVRNLRYIVSAAAPFARSGRWQELIALRPGMDAGEWRDSNDGLGGGRYPYDVNAILVPAALDAATALVRSGLLAPYLTTADREALAGAALEAAAWRRTAPPLFDQQRDPADARAAIGRYAAAVGVPAAPALAAVGDQPVRFHAIALDRAGKPVPVLNSDDGFAMLFGRPTAERLDVAASTIARPFPAGLMTGAGMLVANPVFASPAIQARFGANAYHGTVIWSWQQALAAAGLARQLGRTDLDRATCTALRTAQARLWRAIDATRSLGNSELWSWHYVDGAYRPAAFGASGADADESNAAQLWSTVYLAVQPPVATASGCGAR